MCFNLKNGYVLSHFAPAVYIFRKKFGEKVSFFYTSGEKIKKKEKILATKFQNALSIPGTQKFHKIIPVSNSSVKIYEMSDADEGEERIILKN